MYEFVQPNHVAFSDDLPYLYITNHDSPQIRHKLPRGDVEMVQKLHNEGVDGKPKPALENSFVKTHFPRQEMTSPFLFAGKTNSNPLRELKPISKLGKGVRV